MFGKKNQSNHWRVFVVVLALEKSDAIETSVVPGIYFTKARVCVPERTCFCVPHKVIRESF